MAQGKTRLPNLDALRILAALGVCMFHLNWYGESGLSSLLVLGYLGVNVFFCISGYITPLVLQWSKFTFSDTGRFLLSRFMRLYPAFAVMALIEIFIYSFGSPLMGYGQKIDEITWARTFANFFLYADFVGESWYVAVFWTLAVEAQFVIAMLVVFPLLSHSRQWIRVAVVLVWALAPLTVGNSPTLLTYAALYSMGMAAYLKHYKKLPSWIFLILLACAFCSEYLAVSGNVAWTALGTALIVTYAPQLSETWVKRLRIDHFGKLSYSFFLLHITFGGAVMVHFKHFPNAWMYQFPALLLATAFSVFVASIFHRWIEHPLHVYSRKLKAA
ncbi:MAG: acyltransferase family protein [Akkermansiaceae bacterium]